MRAFDVAIRIERGDFCRDVGLVSDTAVTALVGPSGGGKTSLLLAIAGLLRPVEGTIAVAGVKLFDAAAGICTPARDRGIGIAFQDGRLFPHLSVAANLGYAGKASADEVAALAERLGITAMLRRWPRHLSGGEARRVALGRALLAKPRALLLDEPLAHVDPARAGALLEVIADAARTVPVLYVTHDEREADRLGATIIRW